MSNPVILKPRRAPTPRLAAEDHPRVRRFWEAVANFCTSHNLLFRITFNGFTIVGTAVASITLQAGSWIGGTVAALLTATAVGVRERTGTLFATERIPAANRAAAAKVLKLACEALTPVTIPTNLATGTKVMRANIMRPHDDGLLRIWASFNMEGDDDRQIPIDLNTGVVGDVWRRCNGPIAFDRVAAPSDPRSEVAPSYSNAAVRGQMRSILCTPIYHPHTPVDTEQTPQKIGLLCFDSDLPMTESGFDQPASQDMATLVADLVAIPVLHSFYVPNREA